MSISQLALLTSITLAAASPFTGSWASVQSFGHVFGAGRVQIVASNDNVTATVAGETHVASLSRPGPTAVKFSDGSRLMLFASAGGAFTAQWIQPATVTYGGQYATPIVLSKHGEDGWTGAIHPVRDATHMFLTITQNADGTLGAVVRNPEINAGARIGLRTFFVNGKSVSLRAAGKQDINGTYDPQANTLRFSFDGYPAPFTFTKVEPASTAGFAPRAGQSPYIYKPPVRTDDGWQTASLTDVGLDPAKVSAFIGSILASPASSPNSPYITSVSIARHGKLVLDEYFYGYDAATPHDVRSAGKSLTTLMVGEAMEGDRKLTPDSLVYDLLPQYDDALSSDPRKKTITVADLMTMSSGLACDDNDDSSPGNEDTMEGQTAVPDWYRYTLALPVVVDPGSKAVYCSGGINVLGALIAAATHESLADYFYTKFAEPMQFGPYALPLMPAPTSDAYMAGGGQFLPRDFLKFGQVILDGGMWNGRRILDARFLASAIAPHSALNAPGDYGYGWHLSTFEVGGVSYPAINAGGNGGQLLFVIPKLDMTVMITAANYGQYGIWRHFQTDPFVNYLIPAATS